MPKDKQKKTDRKKKAGKKGSQFAIRVEKSERDAFVTLCERLDTSAAREIRQFMRQFVAAHAAADAGPVAAEAEHAPEPETKPRAPRKPRIAKAAAPEQQDKPASAPVRRRKAAAEAPAT
jgi:hypothetical protein